MREATDEEMEIAWIKARDWYESARPMFSDTRAVATTAVAEYIANQFGATLSPMRLDKKVSRS